MLIPRLTTAQRDAIAGPARSLLIYNVDCDRCEYYDGTQWVPILPGGSGGSLTALSATGVSGGVFTANWTSYPGVTTYYLDVARDPQFTNFVSGYNNLNVGNVTSYVVNTGSCGTYYYRVKAEACGLVVVSNVQVVEVGSYNPCTAPNSWASLPNPPAAISGRNNYPIASVNGKVYMGLGDDGIVSFKDWWEWDPYTGQWTQKANFPGAARAYPFCFVLGGQIYVGGGQYGPVYADCYRYNPATNTWTQIANLPTSRWGCAGTSDGQYGYVLGGRDGGWTYLSEVLRYNPGSNSWSLLSNYPGGGRHYPFLACLGGKLYAGTGLTASRCTQDVWAYDLSGGTWTPLANCPVTQVEGWAAADPGRGRIYVTGGIPLVVAPALLVSITTSMSPPARG